MGKQLVKDSLEKLFASYEVQPVGNGFVDLIVSRSNALGLLDELAKLSIRAESVSWWCLCTPENQTRLGCPHGMGGPRNRFGSGWFSECVHYPIFDVSQHGEALMDNSECAVNSAVAHNHIVRNYLENDLPQEAFFSDCLYPSLSLQILGEVGETQQSD